MKVLISGLLTTMLWLNSMGVYSSDVVVCDKNELAEKAIELSGFTNKAQEIANVLSQMMQSELFAGFTDEEKLQATNIIVSRLNMDTLIVLAKEAMIKELSVEEMQTLVTWYGSETSKRLKEMEKGLMTKETLMLVYQNTQDVLDKHADRIPTVKQICKSAKSDELMQLTQQFLMDTFLILNGTPVSKTDSAAMCQVSDTEALEVLAIACFLHAYAEATDEDLKQLQQHLYSDASINLTNLVHQVFGQAFDEVRQLLTEKFAHKVQ